MSCKEKSSCGPQDVSGKVSPVSVVTRSSLSVLGCEPPKQKQHVLSSQSHYTSESDASKQNFRSGCESLSFFNKPLVFCSCHPQICLSAAVSSLIYSTSFAAHIIKTFSDTSASGNCKGNNEMSMTLRCCWDAMEKTIVRLFQVSIREQKLIRLL